MTDSNVESRLQFLPVAFFAVVMGLTGLAIAWRQAEAVFDLPVTVSGAPLLLAVLTFLSLLVLYGLKVLRFSSAVQAELGHPIQLNFFPAVSISFILLGIAFLPSLPGVASVLWVLGSSLHLLLTLVTLVVLYLLYRTFRAVGSKAICAPHP